MLPLFPDVKQAGRGQRGSNFSRQVLSLMTPHPVPGGPQAGRKEKATITVINGVEGLAGSDITRSPSCLSGEGGQRQERRDGGEEMEVPEVAFLFFPLCLLCVCECACVVFFLSAQRKKTNTTPSLTNFCCG